MTRRRRRFSISTCTNFCILNRLRDAADGGSAGGINSHTVVEAAEKNLDSLARSRKIFITVKQNYHTIIRPTSDGRFIGWVEEVPGTITRGGSIAECRGNLRDALRIMLESIRSEARRGLDESCLQEMLEIEVERELQLA